MSGETIRESPESIRKFGFIIEMIICPFLYKVSFAMKKISQPPRVVFRRGSPGKLPGFTVLELLISMTVLGVLTASIIPTLVLLGRLEQRAVRQQQLEQVALNLVEQLQSEPGLILDQPDVLQAWLEPLQREKSVLIEILPGEVGPAVAELSLRPVQIVVAATSEAERLKPVRYTTWLGVAAGEAQ